MIVLLVGMLLRSVPTCLRPSTAMVFDTANLAKLRWPELSMSGEIVLSGELKEGPPSSKMVSLKAPRGSLLERRNHGVSKRPA